MHVTFSTIMISIETLIKDTPLLDHEHNPFELLHEVRAFFCLHISGNTQSAAWAAVHETKLGTTQRDGIQLWGRIG